ncbi:MAG: polysaccharide biosynthesis C-terminal domain-containing protein [Roseiflexaceae bacterium]|nr:polysaccharide biosynthesis C-terminal domain-containing protein [Roseiflexaceae bacterium]
MAPETRTTRGPSLSSQVSRAVIWNTLFVPLRIIAEVVATLLKLTVLSPASYGLLTLINATNNALGTWIDLGTGRALPKYIPETLATGGPRAMRRLVLLVLGTQATLLTCIAIGFIALRDSYLGDLRTKILRVEDLAAQTRLLAFVSDHGGLIIAAVLAMLLMGIGYDVLMAYLSSFFKQKAWNGIALTANLLPPLLTSVAILANWDVAGVLLAGVLAPTIATSLVTWQVIRHWNTELQIPHTQAPDSAQPGRFGLPPGFIRYCAVAFLMTATDFLASAEFVVFFVETLVAAAIIKAGVSIVKMMLSYLYTPIVGVQIPLFTRVRAGEGGTLNGAYQSIVRLQVLLFVPGGVGLMLLAQPIFVALFPKYVTAAELVWVLVPCLFLESLLITAHNALSVYEKLHTIVISRVLTLISVPLVLLLTPVFGPIGAALAFGIARVVAGLWVTLSGVRLLGLRWPWRFTFRVLLASGVMALPVFGLTLLMPGISAQAELFVRLREALLLAGVATIGAVCFVAVLRLTGGLDPLDREQLAKTKLPLKKWVLRVL